jgi:thymidylate synthase (FAD)
MERDRSMIKVTYIDHMGSDLSVVNAARVSFGKTSEMDMSDKWGPPKLKDKDAKLIKYLAKHKHTSPFNHTFLTVHVKAPIFVARQLQKHEYMPWNEISRRYVDDEPEFYEPDHWRDKSKDKKQGSGGKSQSQYFPNIYVKEVAEKALGDYKKMLSQGIAPEQARMILPQNMMTEWYWSGTLGAWAKMCNLRCKPDTQLETRTVGNEVSDIMSIYFPVSWKALKHDY